MIKGLEHDVFQVGAVTIAKLHLSSGKEIGQMAREIWQDYSRNFDDNDAVQDLSMAASEIVAYLRDEIRHPHAVAVTHHAQFYCKYYDDEGGKRKTGIGGLIKILRTFPPAPRQRPGDRVVILIKKFKRYQLSLDAGLKVPEAPDGWHL